MNEEQSHQMWSAIERLEGSIAALRQRLDDLEYIEENLPTAESVRAVHRWAVYTSSANQAGEVTVKLNVAGCYNAVVEP